LGQLEILEKFPAKIANYCILEVAIIFEFIFSSNVDCKTLKTEEQRFEERLFKCQFNLHWSLPDFAFRSRNTIN